MLRSKSLALLILDFLADSWFRVPRETRGRASARGTPITLLLWLFAHMGRLRLRRLGVSILFISRGVGSYRHWLPDHHLLAKRDCSAATALDWLRKSLPLLQRLL